MSEPTGPGMGRPSGPGFTSPPLNGTDGVAPDPSPALPSSDRSVSGPFPSGPSPSGPLPPGPPGSGQLRLGQARNRPRNRRLPTVLTVAAVAVVAAVVGVASVLAARDDVRLAAPPPRPAATLGSTASPLPPDRIEFATESGTGVLEITDHAWDSDGSDPDAPGTLLTVAVRVTCGSGIVRYGPDAFQAFDRSGDLFDPVYLPDSATALQLGILSAGQQVTGTVAFDIPRGGVTLLMTDASSRTVTALKVPD